MAGIATKQEVDTVVKPHAVPFVDDAAKVAPESGTFWIFDDARSASPSWRESSPVVALRHRLALSHSKLARAWARTEALLVAYHRFPGGNVAYSQVMTFRAMLEASPEALQARILQVIEGLESSGSGAKTAA